MAKLTAEQVTQLADNFMRMANALGDYRYNNIDALSEEENLMIKELHNQQLQHTTELYTKSAVLVMNDVGNALNQIDTITTDTQKLYSEFGGVQKVLDRAASIFNLATAIISLDVNGITDSIKNVINKES